LKNKRSTLFASPRTKGQDTSGVLSGLSALSTSDTQEVRVALPDDTQMKVNVEHFANKLVEFTTAFCPVSLGPQYRSVSFIKPEDFVQHPTIWSLTLHWRPTS